MFMLGVRFCRNKLKPRPNSDLNLGVGLEVWQISWQVILLNLFWYYVTFNSPITCRTLAIIGLDGSTRKTSLLNRCSLNLESRSSARSSYSNVSCRSFLTAAGKFGVFVCVKSAWITISLDVIIFLLYLSLWCPILRSFVTQVLVDRLCWLARFIEIFWFPALLGSILGGFGWST